jgi:hypothetical protein
MPVKRGLYKVVLPEAQGRRCVRAGHVMLCHVRIGERLEREDMQGMSG